MFVAQPDLSDVFESAKFGIAQAHFKRHTGIGQGVDRVCGHVSHT